MGLHRIPRNTSCRPVARACPQPGRNIDSYRRIGGWRRTALFTVVKAVLLNPLPYADPGRLAWLTEINEKGRSMQVAFQNFLDWRGTNRTFSLMGAYEAGPTILSSSDVPQERLSGFPRLTSR